VSCNVFRSPCSCSRPASLLLLPSSSSVCTELVLSSRVAIFVVSVYTLGLSLSDLAFGSVAFRVATCIPLLVGITTGSGLLVLADKSLPRFDVVLLRCHLAVVLVLPAARTPVSIVDDRPVVTDFIPASFVTLPPTPLPSALEKILQATISRRHG